MTLALPSRRLPPQWVRNDLWRRARAVPSLDLQFADRKSLVDGISGQNLITFTRASSGTYVDSAGVLRTAANDEPRFDHNPTTGESLGLLVEEQRQNLLLRSEEFDSGSWTKQNVVISADSITAPSGLSTADTLTDNANDTDHRVIQNLTLNGGAFTFSVYAKKGTANFMRLRANDGTADRNVWFNLDTGQIGTPAVNVSASMINVGNGWYRCIGTWSASFAGLESYTIAMSEADGVSAYVGTGKTIYLWGAQVEAGSGPPTSYIPTTGSAATRAADVASITGLGANVRSLFSQFRSPASGTRPIVSLDDNTASERIELFTSGTDPKLLLTDGGVAQADLDAGTITANTSTRLAARFTTNDFAASAAGGASVLDTSGTMPSVDRIRIGANQAGDYLNGHIARLTGWNEPLPMLPPVTS